MVDDEWDIAEAVIYLLETDGHCALHATNGARALQALAATPADLVVSDYMMPVMDGCQLLQAMRRHGSHSAIPVLLMSALPEDVVRGKCALVQAFLRKPFRSRQLLDAVHSLLDPPADPDAGETPHNDLRRRDRPDLRRQQRTAMSQVKPSAPEPIHPEQPNPGLPGFAGQPPMGQPGQGELEKPELLPPKEGEQRPD